MPKWKRRNDKVFWQFDPERKCTGRYAKKRKRRHRGPDDTVFHYQWPYPMIDNALEQLPVDNGAETIGLEKEYPEINVGFLPSPSGPATPPSPEEIRETSLRPDSGALPFDLHAPPCLLTVREIQGILRISLRSARAFVSKHLVPAGAVYKIGQQYLVRAEVFNRVLQRFRVAKAGKYKPIERKDLDFFRKVEELKKAQREEKRKAREMKDLPPQSSPLEVSNG